MKEKAHPATYTIRMPDHLRDKLEGQASQQGRSLHAEILLRLEASLELGEGAPKKLPIPLDLREWLAGEAAEDGLTFGQEIVSILRGHMEARKMYPTYAEVRRIVQEEILKHERDLRETEEAFRDIDVDTGGKPGA